MRPLILLVLLALCVAVFSGCFLPQKEKPAPILPPPPPTKIVLPVEK